MLWSTSGCSAPRPDNLGLKNNLLLSCPKSPNCVLSQASDPKHQIHPIHYTSSVEIAKEKISPPKVSIKCIMKVSSPLPNGIEIVKAALSEAEKNSSSNTEIKISYLCAPKYRLVVEATDYKEAEKVLKNVVDVVQSKMKKRGTFQISRNKN